MIQLGRKYVLASKYGFSFAIRASLIGGSGRQWDVYLRKQLNHKYKICWRRSWVRFTWKDQRPSATAQKADDQTWSEMLMFCVTVGHHETRELTQFMFCSKINVQLCNALFTWISLLLGMLWLVGPQQQKQLTRGELFLPLPCRYKWRRVRRQFATFIPFNKRHFSVLLISLCHNPLPFKLFRYFLWKISQCPKKPWQILARGLVRMANTLCFAG